MNAKQNRWSKRYQAALQKQLKQGTPARPPLATGLGRQAVVLGLKTLDIAKIHAGALATLHASAIGNAQRRRANAFFIETIAPIEGTHGAAQKAGRHVKRLTLELSRRTAGLASSQKSLKRRIAQRKDAEEELDKSGKRNARLLEASHGLQDHLRSLTRRILRIQEQKKREISRALHNDIAQTLLSIHIRLLTLKTAARVSSEKLKKEIAETQRLVKHSAITIRRVAHEYGRDYEP